MAGDAAQAAVRGGWRGWSRRRWQRALRLGCLPVAVLGGLLVTGLANAATAAPPPPWAYYDPRSHLIRGHLAVSAGTLAVLQMLATWLMGLLAAVQAGRAVPGQAVRLGPRLKVVRRQLRNAVWAVVALRLMLLAVALLGGVLVFTRWLGQPVTVEGATRIQRAFEARPVLMLLPAGLVAAQLLAGPFLRLRTSAALGALGAALAGQAERRAWGAAAARLGAGLALALALIWGAAGSVLLLIVSYDPFYSARYAGLPTMYPLLPDYISRVLTASLVVGALAGINLLGQIALPSLYAWLAGRVLRQRGRGARSPV